MTKPRYRCRYRINVTDAWPHPVPPPWWVRSGWAFALRIPGTRRAIAGHYVPTVLVGEDGPDVILPLTVIDDAPCPRRAGIVSRTRSTLYRAARLLGDVEAASKGPAPLARRLVRKSVYRRTGGLTRRLLRMVGL